MRGSSRSPQALKHPFSITVFEDLVYWSDWHTHTIYQAGGLLLLILLLLLPILLPLLLILLLLLLILLLLLLILLLLLLILLLPLIHLLLHHWNSPPPTFHLFFLILSRPSPASHPFFIPALLNLPQLFLLSHHLSLFRLFSSSSHPFSSSLSSFSFP